MDWSTPHFLPTLNGYHILVWLAAYVAWRYLTAKPRKATRTVAREPGLRRVPRPAPAVLIDGRYERRPEQIAAFQARSAKSSARRAA
jgi:hypothetical protein